MSREQLAKDNGMTIEFVNWFFDNKKDGCGNAWFIMMAAMWEGWSGREAKCEVLAADNEKAMEAMRQADEVVKRAHSKFSALADENMALRSAIENSMAAPQTPTTDAFLAEVRAQGVDAAIERLIQKFEGTGHIGVPVMVLEHFAAQLRQEAAQ